MNKLPLEIGDKVGLCLTSGFRYRGTVDELDYVNDYLVLYDFKLKTKITIRISAVQAVEALYV